MVGGRGRGGGGGGGGECWLGMDDPYLSGTAIKLPTPRRAAFCGARR